MHALRANQSARPDVDPSKELFGLSSTYRERADLAPASIVSSAHAGEAPCTSLVAARGCLWRCACGLWCCCGTSHGARKGWRRSKSDQIPWCLDATADSTPKLREIHMWRRYMYQKPVGRSEFSQF